MDAIWYYQWWGKFCNQMLSVISCIPYILYNRKYGITLSCFSTYTLEQKKPILLSLRSITDKASPVSISQPLKLVTSRHISPGPTPGPGLRCPTKGRARSQCHAGCRTAWNRQEDITRYSLQVTTAVWFIQMTAKRDFILYTQKGNADMTTLPISQVKALRWWKNSGITHLAGSRAVT